MKEFNLVLSGVGGQGVITLARIIAEAALVEGYDVKTSELHGLAQRGGHIECHVRFGKKVYSSLVRQGKADLVMGLEPLEALRVCYYASREKGTIFLVNSYRMIPLSIFLTKDEYPSLGEIVDKMKQFSSRVIILNASDIVKKEAGTITPTNVYMLGYAKAKDMIPLEKESLEKGIKRIIPLKYVELNLRIFNLNFDTYESKKLSE